MNAAAWVVRTVRKPVATYAALNTMGRDAAAERGVAAAHAAYAAHAAHAAHAPLAPHAPQSAQRHRCAQTRLDDGSSALHAFDGEQSARRSPLADGHQPLVIGRVVKGAQVRHVGKLQDHLALRNARAFQHRDSATAHQVAPAVRGNQVGYLGAVGVVGGKVGDFDVGIDVGGHGRLPGLCCLVLDVRIAPCAGLFGHGHLQREHV